MANEPTISDMNSVIAVFDGGKLISDCSIIDDDQEREYWQFKGSIVATGMLKYHKSWDDLVPVIKKIKGMHMDILQQAFVLDYMKAAAHMNSGLLSLDIDKAHRGVYDFLTWYNQQKQKDEQT